MSQPTIGDIGRWLFWGPFRHSLSPHRPRQTHLFKKAWRAQWLLSHRQHRLMKEELERCFPNRAVEPLIPKAYQRAWQIHLEELMLAKFNQETIQRQIHVDGAAHLEAALSHQNGVLLLYPHAGPVMLMMAWLAHNGYPYVQYAARGLPPEEMANAHPEILANNWFKTQTRAAREQAENSLPVQFVTLEHSVRPLIRALADNQIVGIAFDGRIGKKWLPMSFLNRTALLSSGPYRLANRCEATILPTFCWIDEKGQSRITFLNPIRPHEDWKTTAKVYLDAIARVMTAHPEEYALWLLHCRQRCGIDDHPLFIDHAPDNRYTKWMGV
ncbi:MAG: lysophospholipid acyltransferase family protein [Myxococcota bacterium]